MTAMAAKRRKTNQFPPAPKANIDTQTIVGPFVEHCHIKKYTLRNEIKMGGAEWAKKHHLRAK